ncbi:uncharacterized protein [Montipora capricornis]|uniref:uncharacterized protein n=1 Tax=Montipora capricornis TaxID=246305 RepID=UPI0035F17C36
MPWPLNEEMPPVKKKKRVKTKNPQELEDTESSESGKLSETHEVAQHLSRTRLDKENTSRKAKGSDKRKGLRQVGDPYDADSEPEPAAPLTSMLIDQNIPLDRQPFHSRLSSLHAEHSTPSLPSSDHHISDCFGFDNMAISLPISPVRGEPMVSSHLVLHSPGSASVTSSITSISPGKRKADQRIFDVPIEKPIKKIKKKKPNKLPDVTEDDDWVVEMKSQFEEIEMLDLVID